MRQISQSLKDGSTTVRSVPGISQAGSGILVRSEVSLISAGTERMLQDFGRANYIQKARQQPDKVRDVLNKLRTDGIAPTVDAVLRKLNNPLPLGYCNVGRVLSVGKGLPSLAIGDRVASNGHHSELVQVPVNLSARVPACVEPEDAAFTVLGAIALQGIRLVAPTLGEAVVVTGLGLVGQLTVQLLHANGCRVLGLDFDPRRLQLAAQSGAEVFDLSGGRDPFAAAQTFSRGRGVDAVLLTASTSSNDPVHQAAQMCRKRGRIVLVGVTGLELSRADFFEKELTFQVSCSYGPGRYDPNYEQKGQDYPVGFVRWTEQRNMEAVLDMLADGRLNVKPLISHRFSINDAEAAYEIVAGAEPSLGIMLTYPTESEQSDEALQTSTLSLRPPASGSGKPAVSFLGAGNYASGMLIPAFQTAGARLRSVVSSGGFSAANAGEKFSFEQVSTDTNAILADDATDAVVISTRHDSHAHFVLAALAAGKHVFVEKPLCLTHDELTEIRSALDCAAGLLMVGFNRRFAPQVVQMKSLLARVSSPKTFVMTVNAGAIPSDHWTQDTAVGGGRLVGEACHFIDLLRFLAGAAISDCTLAAMRSLTNDTATISMEFADGSIGTVHYFANGNKAFPKERLEVFAEGGILQLDNFRKLTGFGWPGFKRMRLARQDKGQVACVQAFVAAISAGGVPPIPYEELLEVSRISIDAANL